MVDDYFWGLLTGMDGHRHLWLTAALGYFLTKCSFSREIKFNAGGERKKTPWLLRRCYLNDRITIQSYGHLRHNATKCHYYFISSRFGLTLIN